MHLSSKHGHRRRHDRPHRWKADRAVGDQSVYGGVITPPVARRS